MLFASICLIDLAGRRPTNDLRIPFNLDRPFQGTREEGHTKVNDDSSNALGRALGYRLMQAVKLKQQLEDLVDRQLFVRQLFKEETDDLRMPRD